jgi:hypothetical protein
MSLRDKLAFLKHNPLTVFLYNKYLDFRTANVKAYVFAATTGRSGTSSLGKIFSAVPGSICFHEPYPIMFNDCPEGVDIRKYRRHEFYVKKRTNIKRSAIGFDYYVETNHQFIRSFYSHAIDYFKDKIKIIHLYRDPVKVARSFYSINSIPGVTRNGLLYMIDPRDHDNVIQISDLLFSNGEFGHDLYKTLWYWYETEARAIKARQAYPDITWFDLKTEELGNRDKAIEMFDTFKMPYDADILDSVIGTRTNLKTDLKSKNIEYEKCKRFHQRFLQMLGERYPGFGNLYRA